MMGKVRLKYSIDYIWDCGTNGMIGESDNLSIFILLSIIN